MQTLFFSSFILLFYTYLGYGLLLWLWLKWKKISSPPSAHTGFAREEWPEVTLVVAAYNEGQCLREKVANTRQLLYPSGKLNLVVVTDGSTDGSPEWLSQMEGVQVMHEPQRKGKVAAINRAMAAMSSEIVVFSDANTLLPPNALYRLIAPFSNAEVGAVAGEKRVMTDSHSQAVGGEGLYWKYESALKRMDAAFHTVVGAAGELFAIRRKLFKPTPTDTILDDFMISMHIAALGYKVAYDPEAYAMEKPSLNMTEELKRKIRISAGGIQSISRLLPLLNPFRFGKLSFQYISHRVLRWTLGPICLLLLWLSNVFLALNEAAAVYQLSLFMQLFFYGLALAGYLNRSAKVNIKGFYVPYYFVFMNWALVLGMLRFANGQSTAIWEKAQRMN